MISLDPIDLAEFARAGKLARCRGRVALVLIGLEAMRGDWGKVSVRRLAALTGLSRASVSRALAELRVISEGNKG